MFKPLFDSLRFLYGLLEPLKKNTKLARFAMNDI